MAVKFEKTGEGRYMLDVTGYVCPHPQLYTKKSLDKMTSGEIVDVVFDNPSSGETIVQMCDQQGHEVLEKKKEGSKFIYTIKKG